LYGRANQNSIGIEHVGSEDDPLTAPQAAASAALIRWLVDQYEIPRTNIVGHDFTPGYSRPGGTSCPTNSSALRMLNAPSLRGWTRTYEARYSRGLTFLN